MIEEKPGQNSQANAGANPKGVIEVKPVIAPQQTSGDSTGDSAADRIAKSIEEIEKPMGIFERKMIRATWCGIGLAAITGAIFFFQFREMQTQTTILRTQAHQAEQDSIAADKRSREQLELDERAWVGPLAIDPFVVAPNVETFFKITMFNSGKTPARKVRAIMTGSVLKKTEKFKPDFDRSGDIGTQSVSIIAPGGNLGMITNALRRDQATINGIRDGSIVVRFYGRVDYVDIFAHPHFTTFCYFVRPDLRSDSACETYNDSN